MPDTGDRREWKASPLILRIATLITSLSWTRGVDGTAVVSLGEAHKVIVRWPDYDVVRLTIEDHSGPIETGYIGAGTEVGRRLAVKATRVEQDRRDAVERVLEEAERLVGIRP